jgi:hypothetical protein
MAEIMHEELEDFQLYQSAITEITELRYISKEYYKTWLENNKVLYKSAPKGKLKSTKVECRFCGIYGWLFKLFSYFEYEKEVMKALEEFDFLNVVNENDVLHWLVQYEKTGLLLFEMGCEFFDTDFVIIKNGSLQLLEDEDIYLALKDFEVLNKFQDTHNSLYFEMLEKYTTEEKIEYEFLNSDDEFEEPELTEEESDNRSSLKYHLLKRGIIY